jgi:5-formyltetrahydrofolate cyclo-ligase
MATSKAELRTTLLAARRALPADVRAAHAARIVARVVATPAFLASRALVTYVPMGAEVDPGAATDAARARGMAIFAPPPGGAAGWTRLDAAYPSTTPATVGPAPIVVVVPGVGFDVGGGRLGRGHGYYDRALAALRASADVAAVVGVAFECQLVPEVPHDPWDEGVDLLVTEARTIAAPARALPPREVGT